MESFLAEEDIEPHAAREQRGETLALRKATLEWRTPTQSDAKPFSLKGITVDFPKGGLTVVCGATGSGKTSRGSSSGELSDHRVLTTVFQVLLALLGELHLVEGTVELPKMVSYAAQHPWLESCSIRDNMWA
jgi:ABC-type transport system involved in cytochrome bd biosynthesis fused ATPase/permease subunit